MLPALLSSKNHKEYLGQFQRWWNGDLDKDRLLRAAARYVAPRAWHDQYVLRSNEGYTGLISAIQASIWLAPKVRKDPLTQALWNLTGQTLAPAFDFGNPDDEAAQETQVKPMETLWEEANIQGLCALLSRTANVLINESLAPWLLRKTMSDAHDFGRRFTNMAWAIRLCRWAQWEASGVLLFPAVHYALCAPDDDANGLWLSEVLDHNPIRQDHVSGPERDLRLDQAELLIEVALGGDPEVLTAQALRLLSEGATIPALYEGLLMAGARLITCSQPQDWYGPICAFLFLESLHVALEAMEPTSQIQALLLGALMLQRAAAEIEQIDAYAPQCLLPKVKSEAPVMIWLHLADALDSDDEKTALRLLSMALASGNDARNLSSFFASYASRNDARLYSLLDMQYVCATLLAFGRARPQTQNRLMAAMVHFLSRCDKDHTLWDLLANE